MARNNRTQELDGQRRRKVTLADKRPNRNRGVLTDFGGYQRLSDFVFNQQKPNSR